MLDALNRQIKTTREGILQELYCSLEKKNVLGIFIKDTHDLLNTAVTEIEEIVDSHDYLVHLMDPDLHGFPLEKPFVLLSDIEKVIHFNIPFNDPQYVKERRKEKFKA